MTRTTDRSPCDPSAGWSAAATEAVDDRWDAVTATIELDPDELEAGATDGLADFSHIEVVFCFDRVDEDTVCRGTRHPRGRTDWPSVGILAQRAKDRPNRIGVTVCRVVAVRPSRHRRHRPRRRRRDAGARREALPGRVRAPGRGAPAGVGDRAHGRVLVGTGVRTGATVRRGVRPRAAGSLGGEGLADGLGTRRQGVLAAGGRHAGDGDRHGGCGRVRSRGRWSAPADSTMARRLPLSAGCLPCRRCPLLPCASSVPTRAPDGGTRVSST